MSFSAFPAPSPLRRALPARRVLALATFFASCALAMGGAYLAGRSARGAAPAATAALPSAKAPASPSPPAPPLRGALSDARDLECLTQAVYYEARGEPESGQAAVAQVVLNRTRQGRYPASVCGVVFQHVRRACQFSFACEAGLSRPRERAAWARARRVSEAALAGRRSRTVGGATQFRVAGLPPAGLDRVARIGAHVFYTLSHRSPSKPSDTPSAAAR